LSDDEDETVRVKLLESLERNDHPHKVYVLKKMVKDPSLLVRRVAQETLSRYETARMLAMGGFKSQLPENFAGKKKVQSLESLQAQDELAPIDLEDLKDINPFVKLTCLHKIRQRTYERAYQPVIELLGVAENEEILATSLRCLTVIGTNADVEAIMHFLPHPSSMVRAAAAEAIEQVANKTQMIFLLLPMVHDKNPIVQGTAARAMLRYELDDLNAHMAKMFAHRARTLRLRFVQFLSNYSGDVVMGYFAKATQDTDARIRKSVASAMFVQQDERAIRILDKLTGDAHEDVRIEAVRIKTAKERGRADDVAELPTLAQVLDVARQMVERMDSFREEQIAEAAADRLRARQVQDTSDVNAVQAFVNKVSTDVNTAKQLEMLKLNKSVILENMGRKLFRMIRSKEVSHEAYDKCVFLINKYIYLDKRGDTKEGDTGSLWSKLSKAAGVKQESEQSLKIRETMRKQYVELGRIAHEISYKENVIYSDLHMDYIELENVDKRLANFEESVKQKAMREQTEIAVKEPNSEDAS